LLEDILREWDGEEKKPILTRLKEKVLKPRSLRERVIFCIYRLKVQKDKLEIVILKLKRRDKEFLGKCVEAKMAKDEGRASIYANECHQIRKIFKVVFYCKVTLEQVVLRLETVEILSDLAASIVIPVNLVKEIKNRLSFFLPSISYQLGEIASELEDMVLVAGRVESKPFEVSSLTEEAKVILEEARVVVEARTKEAFPDLDEQSTPELELG